MSTKATMALAAVLVAGSVSTALAAETFDVDLYRANPNALQTVQVERGAARAFAQARPYRQIEVRQNPTAVYENGLYAGQDPDPNVRLMLRKVFPYQ